MPRTKRLNKRPRTGNASSSFDQSLFIDEERAKGWKLFEKRGVIPGRRVNLGTEHRPLLTQHLDEMHWTKLLDIPISYYPRLVRLFYCNLEERIEPNGEIALTSLVKGIEFTITEESLSLLLDCPTGGERIYFKTYDELKCIREGSAETAMCEHILKEGGYIGQVKANDLKDEYRLLAKYIAANILPKSGHFDQLRALPAYLTYLIATRFPINLPHLILREMASVERHRSLPFGALLTWIFRTESVDCTGETKTTIDKDMDSSSVKKMKQRKNVAAPPPVVESEEGSESEDQSDEMDVAPDAPHSGPGESSRRSRFSRLERRLDSFEQRFDQLQSEVHGIQSGVHEILGLFRTHFRSSEPQPPAAPEPQPPSDDSPDF